MTGSTALYRHYDSAGRLLYIGISLSAAARLAQHVQGSEWARDIASMTVEQWPTRAAAAEAERAAIQAERPMWNRAHNGTKKPAKRYQRASAAHWDAEKRNQAKRAIDAATSTIFLMKDSSIECFIDRHSGLQPRLVGRIESEYCSDIPILEIAQETLISGPANTATFHVIDHAAIRTMPNGETLYEICLHEPVDLLRLLSNICDTDGQGEEQEGGWGAIMSSMNKYLDQFSAVPDWIGDRAVSA